MTKKIKKKSHINTIKYLYNSEDLNNIHKRPNKFLIFLMLICMRKINL